MQVPANTSQYISPSTSEFNRIQKLVYKHTAIVIADAKRDFVRARISRRMRDLQLTTVDEYCEYVETGREDISTFTNQITTNHTQFFRESHHFDILVNHLADVGICNRTIWSAACSSGEEPYSIAIALAENFQNIFSSGLSVLATDIDKTILEKARLATYTEERIAPLTDQQKRLSCIRGKDDHQGMVRIKKPLRDLIQFKTTNLVEPFRFNQRMDIIFCRNVVIYFDTKNKVSLFRRFADLQQSGDLLFIGHSESLTNVCDAYTCLGNTTYQRK